MKKLLICEVGKPATVEDGGTNAFIWERAERLFGKGSVCQNKLFPGIVLWQDEDAALRVNKKTGTSGLDFNRQVPSIDYSAKPTGKEDFIVSLDGAGPAPGGGGFHLVRGNFLIAFEKEEPVQSWLETMAISVLCPRCGKPLAYTGAIYCGAGCAARAGA